MFAFAFLTITDAFLPGLLPRGVTRPELRGTSLSPMRNSLHAGFPPSTKTVLHAVFLPSTKPVSRGKLVLHSASVPLWSPNNSSDFDETSWNVQPSELKPNPGKGVSESGVADGIPFERTLQEGGKVGSITVNRGSVRYTGEFDDRGVPEGQGTMVIRDPMKMSEILRLNESSSSSLFRSF